MGASKVDVSEEAETGKGPHGGPSAGAPLFRQAAVDFFLRGEDAAPLPKVSPPWSWALFWTIWAGLIAVAVTLRVVQVEVVSLGQGTVVAVGGEKRVLAFLPGVRPGTIPFDGPAQVRVGDGMGGVEKALEGRTVSVGEIPGKMDGAWVGVLLPSGGKDLVEGSRVQVRCVVGRERLGHWLFPALGKWGS